VALPPSNKATPVTRPLRQAIDRLPSGAPVLDIGCLGWKLKALRPDLAHAGCDMDDVTDLPDGVDYRRVNVATEPLPWGDDSFDLIVMSHLIEHLADPLAAVGQAVRVLKPGGRLYVEAPSDRATLPLALSGFAHGFLGHWDDPTHHRPWPPRALYRLAVGYQLIPEVCDYDHDWRQTALFPFAFLRHAVLDRDADGLTDHWWKAIGFAAMLLARKPRGMSGGVAFQYRSFKGLSEPDVMAALTAQDRDPEPSA